MQEVNKFGCDNCGESIGHKCELQKHVEGEHETQDHNFKCECRHVTLNHQAILRENEPSKHSYNCPKCEPVIISNTKKKLKHHMETPHNYICYKCPAAFRSEVQRAEHKAEEYGGIRFQCNHCVLTFGPIHGLKLHVKGEHDEVRLTDKFRHCLNCAFRLHLQHSLRKHMKDEHGGKYVKFL